MHTCLMVEFLSYLSSRPEGKLGQGACLGEINKQQKKREGLAAWGAKYVGDIIHVCTCMILYTLQKLTQAITRNGVTLFHMGWYPVLMHTINS